MRHAITTSRLPSVARFGQAPDVLYIMLYPNATCGTNGLQLVMRW
jgi:hypothetical protein